MTYFACQSSTKFRQEGIPANLRLPIVKDVVILFKMEYPRPF